MALPSPLESFVWGAGGAALTPEQIARQREIADALTAKGIDTSPVGSWAQGAARVADALVGVVKERRASNAEGANAATNSNIVQSLLQGGTSGFPAAPTGAFPAAPSSSTQAGPVSAPEGIADGIRQTAAALGIDPVDLGTAISYETAGTFDPMKKGPTTQWGQHRGLIQFGEPQAAQNGVDWSNPVGSQLGPDGAVAKYLRAAGVKPGMGLLDVYSAINAGGVGKYNASDANNGGAPGTVRDKVEKQMAAHRAKALALLGGGNQVASMDPGIGLAPPANMQNTDPGISAAPPADMANPDPGILQGYAPGDSGATTPAGQRVLAAMMGQQPMAGAPMPLQDAVPPQLQQPVSDPQQQVAQAQDLSQIPVMAGGTADAIPARQAQRGINPAIIDALSNPAASEQTRKIAGMLLGQQMQQNDPAAQLEMKYKQAQIDALNAKATAGGESVFGTPIYGKDPKTGETVLGAIGKNGTFHRLDTGGVQVTPGVTWQDMGTYRQGFDKSGAAVTPAVPIDNAGKASDTAAGKGTGEARVTYESMSSKMPGLEQVVGQLDDLAGKATYTAAGQLLDWGRKEIGMEPREAAIARTNYIAMVNNQILPMLRDTFGAQFTEREGETLRETMGDPNKSPAEKQTVLKAFIEQKRRDVAALAAQTGQGGQQDAPAGKKRLKFNPTTGELE